jgi:hypothetical protein
MPFGREYLGSDADAVIRRFRPQPELQQALSDF